MKGWVTTLIYGVLTACGAADIPYEIVGDGIPTALTVAPADATRGQAVFAARDAGHCVLCHQIDSLEAEFQGNVGPALSAVGARLTEAQLRLRLVDYEVVKSGTVMPSYFRTHNLNQVGQSYEGQTVLSVQDIEDLIAYLGTLTGDTR